MDRAWLGGGLAEDVAKDLHTFVIDTVPWRNNAGGGTPHRLQWGHGWDWYNGSTPTEQTLASLQRTHVPPLSMAEATQLYWRNLGRTGSGRAMIMERIRQSYPRLSVKQAELLADGTFFSHINLDSATIIPADIQARIREVQRFLQNPSPELMETVLALDAMKVEGNTIATRAARFVGTGNNQERLAATVMAKNERGLSVFNPTDQSGKPLQGFIGVRKGGKEYLVVRGSTARVASISNKFSAHPIMVPDDIFQSLSNDLSFQERIRNGMIVPESRILSRATIESTGPQQLKRESETLIAKGEGIYAASRMDRMLARVPADVRISVKAGGIASLFSAIPNTWNVIQGEASVMEAMGNVIADGLHAGVSQYMTLGLIQNLGGGKYALTAIVDASAREVIPGTAKVVIGTSAFLNYGVATFIFDETSHVFHLASGKMDVDTFFVESGKSGVKSAVSGGSAAFCAVVLGWNPAGIGIMAISVGSYMAVSAAFDYADRLDASNYVFIEDVLPFLPLEMQQRITPETLRISPIPEDIRISPQPSDVRISPLPEDIRISPVPSL